MTPEERERKLKELHERLIKVAKEYIKEEQERRIKVLLEVLGL